MSDDTKEISDLEGKCIVCGHDLSNHIEEEIRDVGYWRCHGHGRDTLQCECRLFKRVAGWDKSFYDARNRIESLEED